LLNVVQTRIRTPGSKEKALLPLLFHHHSSLHSLITSSSKSVSWRGDGTDVTAEWPLAFGLSLLALSLHERRNTIGKKYI